MKTGKNGKAATAVVKGNTLIITIPLHKPQLSQSGRTRIVAHSDWLKSESEVKGKQVQVPPIHAFIK